MFTQTRIPINEGAATVARTTRPLTNTEILRAKALEKDLTLHDGEGLFLIVKTNGKNSGVSVINAQRQSSGQ